MFDDDIKPLELDEETHTKAYWLNPNGSPEKKKEKK
jgi:hypothetical protein